MATKTYNGHKNRAYWNVALWLSNDEPLYRLMRATVARCATKDQAARELLAQLPEKTPDGVPYSFSSVRAALVGE